MVVQRSAGEITFCAIRKSLVEIRGPPKSSFIFTGGQKAVPFIYNRASSNEAQLHILFDRGYLTVTPDLHIEVSQRIKQDYGNGKECYAMLWGGNC